MLQGGPQLRAFFRQFGQANGSSSLLSQRINVTLQRLRQYHPSRGAARVRFLHGAPARMVNAFKQDWEDGFFKEQLRANPRGPFTPAPPLRTGQMTLDDLMAMVNVMAFENSDRRQLVEKILQGGPKSPVVLEVMFDNQWYTMHQLNG